MRRTEHMVPCRDGVRLATDVYLPEGAGPFPVILERTPYGKREVSRSEVTAANPVPVRREEVAAYFNNHGYAVAYQDCRGRYGSEGDGVIDVHLSDAVSTTTALNLGALLGAAVVQLHAEGWATRWEPAVTAGGTSLVGRLWVGAHPA